MVLVNHNGAECLPATLDALARGTIEPRVECLVVDSGSHDGSWRGVEHHWAAARSMRIDENVGFCTACDRGARVARGRLLAFVNFDGCVERGWDRPLRALLDEDPEVSVATGLQDKFKQPDVGEAGLHDQAERGREISVLGKRRGSHRVPASCNFLLSSSMSPRLASSRRSLQICATYRPNASLETISELRGRGSAISTTRFTLPGR